MTTNKLTTTNPEDLDRIAAGVVTIVDKSGFAAAFATAKAVKDLKSSLEPYREHVEALANSPLGFLTDRDPAKGKPGYGWEVIRDCSVEAALRGVQLVGNQWNIISGRTYITQSGYAWLLKKLEGFADFKPCIGCPQIKGDEAVVRCKASWIYKGVKESIGADDADPLSFSIRVNAGMGADAVVGKARRKLLKAVYERVTGSETSDGEVDNAHFESVPSPALPPVVRKPLPPAEPPQKLCAKDTRENLKIMITASNYEFENLADFVVEVGMMDEKPSDWDAIPDDVVTRLVNNSRAIVAGMSRLKGSK